jgi:hypothetical protein
MHACMHAYLLACLLACVRAKKENKCRLLGPNGAGKSTSINMVRFDPTYFKEFLTLLVISGHTLARQGVYPCAHSSSETDLHQRKLRRPATYGSDRDTRAMCVQMIGFMEATEGDAIINGLNIKTSMNDIYTCMVRSQRESPEKMPCGMLLTGLYGDICKAREQRTCNEVFCAIAPRLNALMHEATSNNPGMQTTTLYMYSGGVPAA